MKNARDTFQYENLDRDLKELKPVERPCVLAGMLAGRLEILTFQAEHHEDGVWRKNAALSIGMAVDLLQRLSVALDDTTLLALMKIHVSDGREVCVSGRWFGSYCEAARTIGREYYCAIFMAADRDEYGEWLLSDVKQPRGYKPLPPAIIEDRWPEIAEAILKLPELAFDKLDVGIRREHLAVPGNRFNGV